MQLRFLSFILFTAYASAAVEPQREASFPFVFRDGFIRVNVAVRGVSEPLQMLLDSGAEVSTLNTDTAKRLGLKGGRRVTVVGVGSKTTGQWPLQLHGRVGNVAVPDQFLVADLCELQESCQCPVDGLIGADFFWRKIVQIDFTAKTVRMLENAPGEGQRVPIRFRRQIMQVPLRVGDDAEQWVRLDTGCASAVEWVSGMKAKASWANKVSIGLAELRIPTFRGPMHMGKTSFTDVPIGIHRRALFPAEGGLLGLELLRYFERVTIDSQARQLILHSRKD